MQAEGSTADGSTPALSFLKETMEGYSDFQAIKRFHELQQ
jgi:hypothetical protein